MNRKEQATIQTALDKQRLLVDALQVIVLTPHLRAYLQQYDPMALRQAESAITAADSRFPDQLKDMTEQGFLTGSPRNANEK